MKRFAVLAAALCLMLVACQAPAEPREISPLPPLESSAPVADRPTVHKPPSSGEIPAESPASGSSESEVSDPEPIPQPVLTVSPGVDCKTLLTWDSTQKEIAIGPLCLENKQLLLETAGDQRKALGLDLATGAIDFTLPLEEDSYLREVLGEPGEFLVMGKTGCRHFVWREDGWLGEYPAYDLPDQAREAIKDYKSDFSCRFFWDILPEENLLAWTAADGVWLAEADGSNARLAISAKEVFENPDFDDVRAECPDLFADSNPGSEYGPLLVEPCIMDGGKKLTAVEYVLTPIINHGEGYGLIIFDIPSGDTERHGPRITSGFFELEYLDERTILTGGHKMDVCNGTFETFNREHCYIYPKGWGSSADSIHFFTSYNVAESHQLICYLLSGSDDDYDFNIFNKKIETGQAEVLLDLENGYFYGETPVNGNQVLCFWAPFKTSPDQTTPLLLVTTPEI